MPTDERDAHGRAVKVTAAACAPTLARASNTLAIVSALSAWLDRLRPAWMRDALCREHPEVDFFPKRAGSTREARLVCASCLVRRECAAYALEFDERELTGVWGGTSGRDRRRARSAGWGVDELLEHATRERRLVRG